MATEAGCRRQLLWQQQNVVATADGTFHFDGGELPGAQPSGQLCLPDERLCQHQQLQQHKQQLRIGNMQACDELDVHWSDRERSASRRERPESVIKAALLRCKSQTDVLSNRSPWKDTNPLPKTATLLPDIVRNPESSAADKQTQQVPLTPNQILHASRFQPSTVPSCVPSNHLTSEVLTPTVRAQQQEQHREEKQQLRACVAQFVIREWTHRRHALASALIQNPLSSNLPQRPTSSRDILHDPNASVHGRHARVSLLKERVKAALASRLQSSAECNRGLKPHHHIAVPPLSPLVTTNFEAAARGHTTQPLVPASYNQVGGSTKVGTRDGAPADCPLRNSSRRCQGQEGPSCSNTSSDFSSTFVQRAVASAQDVTKHGRIQTSLSGLEMIGDSAGKENIACESGDKLGCCLLLEEEEEEEDVVEEDEEGEEDLISLRRGMARLNASLWQLRGDADDETMLRSISSFATLVYGLDALERIRNA